MIFYESNIWIQIFWYNPNYGWRKLLFRSISYYLYRIENNDFDIINAVYLYVKNNITLFYEFCHAENNIYFIEELEKIHKYILD